jgi:hypothetical protein
MRFGWKGMNSEDIECPECLGDGWLIYWVGKRGANDPCGSEVQDDCDVCHGSGMIENPNPQ